MTYWDAATGGEAEQIDVEKRFLIEWWGVMRATAKGFLYANQLHLVSPVAHHGDDTTSASRMIMSLAPFSIRFFYLSFIAVVAPVVAPPD